jgi:hypothetical protein
VPLDERERARTEVTALAQCAATYDYECDHSYGRRVTSSKVDFFLELAAPLAALSLWWVDERSVADYLSVWEEGEMRAIAEGDTPVVEFSVVVPVIRAVPALDCIWCVLGAAGISWQKAEHMNTAFHMSWTLPDDTAFLYHPQYFIMLAKLECFLCGPDQVEAREVLDYLPQPGSCKWERDRCNHVVSSTESLGALISKAALACTRDKLAASHAKATTVLHQSQQKVMHAQAALGCALMKRAGKKNNSSTGASEEAAALLSEARESALKMRLQRYAYMIQENEQRGHTTGS